MSRTPEFFNEGCVTSQGDEPNRSQGRQWPDGSPDEARTATEPLGRGAAASPAAANS